MIKVIVAGFQGSMGQQAVQVISQQDDMEVVAGYSPRANQGTASEEQFTVYHSLEDIQVAADVWLDFTTPKSVFENTRFAIKKGFQPIVGTTGLTDEQVAELQVLSEENSIPGLIVPNFSLSAVLLMKFSEEAAHYFPEVEIIEMHHEAKKDAPSGTALMTAKRINMVRHEHEQSQSVEVLPGARGANDHGIPIHSVRLPGYVAHEQVLFGSEGEALTIRQDSFSRSSFMKGIVLAIEKVGQLDHLYIGLEHVM